MLNLHIMQRENMINKKIVYIIVALVLLLFLMGMAFFIGHYDISFSQMMDTFLGLLKLGNEQKLDESFIILYEIRLPRIIAAVLVGASLSVAGAVFQGIFVNPLVSPSILGVLSGASFGAALAMLLGKSFLNVQIFAFLFGFLAVFLALIISKIYGKNNNILMLILGGIISSSLFGALLSLIKFIADPYDTLPSIVYWLMGSLSMANLNVVSVVLPIMLVCILVLVSLGKYINVMSLGEDEALSLGVDIKKVRLMIILLATILSSLSVLLAGIIGWIGLVVPHIARFIIGANHIFLLPFCAILGGIFLLATDSVSRSIMQTEIPLGILTSIFGILVFVFVLRKSIRH